MVSIHRRVLNFTCRLTFEAGIPAESPPADCRGFSIQTPASFPPKFADSVPSSQLPTHPQFLPVTPLLPEMVSQFVVRLRKLAQHCEFRAFILDRVVDKCISKKFHTQLLAERDLTLDRLLTFARAK